MRVIAMHELAQKEWRSIATHYRRNIPEARFKLGDIVVIHCDSIDKRQHTGHVGNVLGLRMAGDEVEYAVSGVEFLVWEHELRGENE